MAAVIPAQIRQVPDQRIIGNISGAAGAGQSLTQSQVRTLLGLDTAAYQPASAFQPVDADLTAIAALSTTSFGRSFLTIADQAAARTYIGAGTSSFSGSFGDLSGVPTTISGYGITNAYTKTEVDNLVTGLLDFKGSLDCSANPNYPTGSKGDSYYVSVAGKVGGVSGKSVEVGDLIVASADNAGGTEASVGTSWFVLEHNLTGALIASNNLSDLTSASTARSNLGLGTLATQNGTFSGTSSGTNTGDQTITLTGDVTGSGTGSFAATLATVNSNVGSFGSATQIPSLTVNAKGLITAVSNVTVTPALDSITGFGTGVAAALAIATGSAGAPVLFNGALGTPASGNLVNCTFPTLNQNTTGNAATVSTIAGMISAGTNVTITGSGTSGSPYVINSSGGGGGGSPGGATTQVQFNDAGVFGGSAALTFDKTTTALTLTQSALTTGSPTALTVTGGAHTTLTASTEATDINLNLARTVQFAAGALTTQRAFRIQAPTYAFASASTITTASTLSISGAPVAGTNATITKSYALNVESGNTFFGGVVRFTSPSNNYIDATSGSFIVNNNTGYFRFAWVGNFGYNEIGQYTQRFVSGYKLQWTSDAWNPSTAITEITSDTANTLDLRRSTNAQTFRVFNTYMSTTSHEYLKFSWATNVAEIGTVKGSGGGSARDLVIKTDDTERLRFASTGLVTVADAHNIATGSTTGTKIGTATTQKLGFWNATPIVQPASANQAALTDSTTGSTADTTLVDVGAVFSQGNVNDNFAKVAKLVNQLRSDLVAAGLIKGSA